MYCLNALFPKLTAWEHIECTDSVDFLPKFWIFIGYRLARMVKTALYVAAASSVTDVRGGRTLVNHKKVFDQLRRWLTIDVSL